MMRKPVLREGIVLGIVEIPIVAISAWPSLLHLCFK